MRAVLIRRFAINRAKSIEFSAGAIDPRPSGFAAHVSAFLSMAAR
jgi:hypothetical protein